MPNILSTLQRESPALNPWFYREKSPERRKADERSADILARLSKESPGALAYQQFPPEIASQVHAYEANPEQWTSDYESRTGDYPIYHAAQWAQSLPSAIYATGKMIGNEVHKATAENEDVARRIPHPEAYDQYRHSANTLTGGAVDPTGPSYWKDVVNTQVAQERAPPVSLYPANVLDSRIANDNHAKAQEIESGSRFLDRSGAHPYVANTLGAMMDAGISFPSSIGPATQALRSGRPLAALMDMTVDVAASNPDAGLRLWNEYWKGKLPWEE